jgi:UTP--glucose-1-phosphate uridylyltransferase
MITQAIIPLAGLGTRMLPLTKAFPKELWPLGKISILERILIECNEAGIKEIFLIISKKKNIIKEYFEKDYELEKKISKDASAIKKISILQEYRKKIKFIYQNSAKGLGDAVNTCRKKIKSDYFLLILPDDIIINKNCSRELISIYKTYKCSVLATKKVKKEDVSRYGILGFLKKKKNVFNINKFIEKPKVSEAPSSYAIIGRYILNKKIFKFLSKPKIGKLGEIQITDAMNDLLLSGEKFNGCIFKGKYLDCGTLDGYIRSFKEVGTK